jgi:hypothetical protein
VCVMLEERELAKNCHSMVEEKNCK